MSRSCNCALTLHASKETSERIAQNGIATQEGGVSECGVKSSTLQAFGKLWVMQLGLKSLFCELHPLFQFISSFPLWYSANFHLLAPITNGESRGGGGNILRPLRLTKFILLPQPLGEKKQLWYRISSLFAVLRSDTPPFASHTKPPLPDLLSGLLPMENEREIGENRAGRVQNAAPPIATGGSLLHAIQQLGSGLLIKKNLWALC